MSSSLRRSFLLGPPADETPYGEMICGEAGMWRHKSDGRHSAFRRQSGLLEMAAVTGLVAGSLDLVGALGVAHAIGAIDPDRALQAVTSSLLGGGVYGGGAPIDLALHYCYALLAAAVYARATLAWPLLSHRAPLCGLAFGLVLCVVTQAATVLTAFPASFWLPGFFAGLLVHVFGVGLPIALLSGRLARGRSNTYASA